MNAALLIMIACACLAGVAVGALSTIWATRLRLRRRGRRGRLADAGRPLELAVPPDPAEAADRERLADRGWRGNPAGGPEQEGPRESGVSDRDRDPFGTRVVSATRGPRGGAGASAWHTAVPPSSADLVPSGQAIRRARWLDDEPAAITAGGTAAILVVHPGNGQATRQLLAGDRSSWRVGAVPGVADIVIPEVGVDVLIGRNGDVWTAASEGPISSSVTLDAVTLPTVPMPWPPDRKLRVGSITMTLERVTGPEATLEAYANETHASLDGRYAAHANKYALALARSGGERAESVASAALACFDSRLLDPARGAALATMNMTLALRAGRAGALELDRQPPELFVGIAGFDRDGRLRAAANFPMAVWAVTNTGSVQLGESRAAGDYGSVEVASILVNDQVLRGIDRPLLLIAAGQDLSAVGPRIRALSTLNTTPAQLASAVVGPPETDAPITAAAAARAVSVRAVSAGARDPR